MASRKESCSQENYDPLRKNQSPKNDSNKTVPNTSDSTLNNLIDKLHGLNLGEAARTFNQRFNFQAWTTPLKSIENVKFETDSDSADDDFSTPPNSYAELDTFLNASKSSKQRLSFISESDSIVSNVTTPGWLNELVADGESDCLKNIRPDEVSKSLNMSAANTTYCIDNSLLETPLIQEDDEKSPCRDEDERMNGATKVMEDDVFLDSNEELNSPEMEDDFNINKDHSITVKMPADLTEQETLPTISEVKSEPVEGATGDTVQRNSDDGCTSDVVDEAIDVEVNECRVDFSNESEPTNSEISRKFSDNERDLSNVRALIDGNVSELVTELLDGVERNSLSSANDDRCIESSHPETTPSDSMVPGESLNVDDSSIQHFQSNELSPEFGTYSVDSEVTSDANLSSSMSTKLNVECSDMNVSAEEEIPVHQSDNKVSPKTSTVDRKPPPTYPYIRITTPFKKNVYIRVPDSPDESDYTRKRDELLKCDKKLSEDKSNTEDADCERPVELVDSMLDILETDNPIENSGKKMQPQNKDSTQTSLFSNKCSRRKFPTYDIFNMDYNPSGNADPFAKTDSPKTETTLLSGSSSGTFFRKKPAKVIDIDELFFDKVVDIAWDDDDFKSISESVKKDLGVANPATVITKIENIQSSTSELGLADEASEPCRLDIGTSSVGVVGISIGETAEIPQVSERKIESDFTSHVDVHVAAISNSENDERTSDSHSSPEKTTATKKSVTFALVDEVYELNSKTPSTVRDSDIETAPHEQINDHCDVRTSSTDSQICSKQMEEATDMTDDTKVTSFEPKSPTVTKERPSSVLTRETLEFLAPESSRCTLFEADCLPIDETSLFIPEVLESSSLILPFDVPASVEASTDQVSLESAVETSEPLETTLDAAVQNIHTLEMNDSLIASNSCERLQSERMNSSIQEAEAPENLTSHPFESLLQNTMAEISPSSEDLPQIDSRCFDDMNVCVIPETSEKLDGFELPVTEILETSTSRVSCEGLLSEKTALTSIEVTQACVVNKDVNTSALSAEPPATVVSTPKKQSEEMSLSVQEAVTVSEQKLETYNEMVSADISAEDIHSSEAEAETGARLLLEYSEDQNQVVKITVPEPCDQVLSPKVHDKDSSMKIKEHTNAETTSLVRQLCENTGQLVITEPRVLQVISPETSVEDADAQITAVTTSPERRSSSEVSQLICEDINAEIPETEADDRAPSLQDFHPSQIVSPTPRTESSEKINGFMREEASAISSVTPEKQPFEENSDPLKETIFSVEPETGKVITPSGAPLESTLLLSADTTVLSTPEKRLAQDRENSPKKANPEVEQLTHGECPLPESPTVNIHSLESEAQVGIVSSSKKLTFIEKLSLDEASSTTAESLAPKLPFELQSESQNNIMPEETAEIVPKTIFHESETSEAPSCKVSGSLIDAVSYLEKQSEDMDKLLDEIATLKIVEAESNQKVVSVESSTADIPASQPEIETGSVSPLPASQTEVSTLEVRTAVNALEPEISEESYSGTPLKDCQPSQVNIMLKETTETVPETISHELKISEALSSVVSKSLGDAMLYLETQSEDMDELVQEVATLRIVEAEPNKVLPTDTPIMDFPASQPETETNSISPLPASQAEVSTTRISTAVNTLKLEVSDESNFETPLEDCQPLEAEIFIHPVSRAEISPTENLSQPEMKTAVSPLRTSPVDTAVVQEALTVETLEPDTSGAADNSATPVERSQSMQVETFTDNLQSEEIHSADKSSQLETETSTALLLPVDLSGRPTMQAACTSELVNHSEAMLEDSQPSQAETAIGDLSADSPQPEIESTVSPLPTSPCEVSAVPAPVLVNTLELQTPDEMNQCETPHENSIQQAVTTDNLPSAGIPTSDEVSKREIRTSTVSLSPDEPSEVATVQTTIERESSDVVRSKTQLEDNQPSHNEASVDSFPSVKIFPASPVSVSPAVRSEVATVQTALESESSYVVRSETQLEENQLSPDETSVGSLPSVEILVNNSLPVSPVQTAIKPESSNVVHCETPPEDNQPSHAEASVDSFPSVEILPASPVSVSPAVRSEVATVQTALEPEFSDVIRFETPLEDNQPSHDEASVGSLPSVEILVNNSVSMSPVQTAIEPESSNVVRSETLLKNNQLPHTEISSESLPSAEIASTETKSAVSLLPAGQPTKERTPSLLDTTTSLESSGTPPEDDQPVKITNAPTSSIIQSENTQPAQTTVTLEAAPVSSKARRPSKLFSYSKSPVDTLHSPTIVPVETFFVSPDQLVSTEGATGNRPSNAISPASPSPCVPDLLQSTPRQFMANSDFDVFSTPRMAPPSNKHLLRSTKQDKIRENINKLLSPFRDNLVRLCTPRNERHTSKTEAAAATSSLFEYETIEDSNKTKITFELPTNLLDLSIDVLESMTSGANFISTSRVTAQEEQTSNAKVIANLEDPCSAENATSESIVADRLREELAAKTKQFDELSNEHEKLLSVCHALRENERLLKEALHGADDTIRVLTNRYELLKEYSNQLVIQLNEEQDDLRKKLQSAEQELRELKKHSC